MLGKEHLIPNLKERLEPKNTEQAFCFQFEDDFRIMKTMAILGPKDFKKAVEVLKGHIRAYELAYAKYVRASQNITTKKKNESKNNQSKVSKARR